MILLARAFAAAVLVFASTAVAHAAIEHARSKPVARTVRLSDLGADAPMPGFTHAPAPALARVVIPPLRAMRSRHRAHRTARPVATVSAQTTAATPVPVATPSPAAPVSTPQPESTLTSAAPPAPAPAAAPVPAVSHPAHPPTSNRPATPPGQVRHGPSFDSSG